ncbi:insulinase family protein [Galbibacter sp. EGI 63066]|uniref:M16 family metallopeptidase n=1 Tax=Galbibacter sp. EGI 63066 TaxID=2993559 RepID=UPI002248B1A2|nr:insulinase family protein [Galbibacter sp. EGI 63066]MCX2681943.1 insulinase family protein [Galbibacter sp. EGI 63066]
MKNTILKIILSVYITGCSVATLTAQNPKTTINRGNSPLQVGQFENGLTYHIYRDSTLDSEKILMGFMVKAGRDKETADELDFAHMIEHIPFVRDSVYPEGIDRFLKYDMVPYADVTAKTTKPFVKYWFHYPNSHPEAFEAGLSWFREIASGLRFDEGIMDRIRSQVQGEMIFRMRTILDCAAGKPYISYRLYGRGTRDFCNIVNDMEEYKAEDLQAFYQRWYIPENMGIFVVGPTTIPTEQVIGKIETQFGDLQQPVKVPEAIDYNEFYLSQENQYINIDTRGLIEIPEIQLYFRKSPKKGICTEPALKLSLLDEMVGSLVTSRIQRRSQSLNNQDIESIVFYPQDLPPSFLVTPKLKSPTSVKKGVQLLIIEFRKIMDNGYTDAEFHNAAKAIEDKYVNREGLTAQSIMDELYENFWREDGFLPREKAQYIKTLLRGLTKQDLNRRMYALFNPGNKVDVVVRAADSSSHGLNKKEVYGWMAEAWKVPVADWEASLKSPEQIKIKPIKELLSQQEFSQLSDTRDYQVNEVPEYGITDMDFPNGMKVVLKPFQPKNGFKDRIQVQLIKAGGVSQFTGEDYAAALYSPDIVSASGLGSYSEQQLEAYFRQPGQGGLQLLPYANHTEIGFRGWYLPGRLEGLLEYLYLYLTQPNVDNSALADWKKSQKVKLLMEQRNNDLKLRDFTRNFFEGQPFVYEETIEAIEKAKVMDLYRILFSGPKGYVVVITGNFDLNTTMESCNKYLGGIPEYTLKNKLITKEKDSLYPHSIPQGPLSFNLDGDDPRKADVRVCYSGRLDYSPKEDAGLFVLNKIFNDRLHNRLRNEEKNSTVYTVFSTYDLFDQNNRYKLTITFNCVNSKTKKMINALKDEIDTLKEQGPVPEVLENVLANISLYYMPAYEDNAEHMAMQLIDRYKYNKEREPLYRLKDYIQNITVADVKELAKKYLNEENYYQFIVSEKSSQVESNNF